MKFGQTEIKDLNSDYLALEIMHNHFIPHCLWVWVPITEELTSCTHFFFFFIISQQPHGAARSLTNYSSGPTLPLPCTHFCYELEVSSNFTKTLNSGNLSYFSLNINALLNKNNIALFLNSMYVLKWKSLCHVQLFDTVHGILQARILEWVAFPFSRGSSQPRDRTQVSCITGRFLTSWATKEAQEYWSG